MSFYEIYYYENFEPYGIIDKHNLRFKGCCEYLPKKTKPKDINSTHCTLPTTLE